jgi:hypothetical protein
MWKSLKQLLQWFVSTHVSREYILRREMFDRSHLYTEISNQEFGRSVFPEHNQFLQTLACVIRSTLAKEIAIDPRHLSSEDDVRVLGYFTEYERWSDDRLFNLFHELQKVLDPPPSLTESQLPILMRFPFSVDRDDSNGYLFGRWVKRASEELQNALDANRSV